MFFNIHTYYMNNFLQYTLVALAILGMLYVYGSYTESFVNLGEYPSSQTNPLLEDDYPVKKNPQLSTDGSKQLFQEQPHTDMSSYAQITNNKRYWSNPNNGTCSPADFCNSIYSNKQIEKHSPVPTPAEYPTRVNYYNIT